MIRDVALCTFAYLDYAELCTLAKVSAGWRKLAEDDKLWKAVYVKFFALEPPNAASVKRQFAEQILLHEQNFHSLLLNAAQITDEVILSALDISANLRAFALNADNSPPCLFTQAGLQAVAQRCANLRILRLERSGPAQYDELTNEALGATCRAARNIRCLTLKGCPEIDALAEIFHCLDLRELAVESRYISDQFVSDVLARYPKLRVLDLCGCCDSMTDNTLRSIVRSAQPLIRCEVRNIKNCFTQESVQSLINHLQNMDAFGLSGYDGITDAMLQTLADRNPKMTYLYLSGATSVTTQGLDYLALRCQKLQALVIQGSQDRTRFADHTQKSSHFAKIACSF